MSSVKSDYSLFSSLYISCQTRDGNLDELFEHENQACPPSLSNMGKLRLGTESDLVSCLEKLVSTPSPTDLGDSLPSLSLGTDTAIVNMLKPGTARTFASQVFLPYITMQLQNVLWYGMNT